MVETVISLIIVLISIAPIIIIGIGQYRSKDPVGFWTGKNPPKKEQITDVKAYNQKHGLMWILLGVGFLLCFAGGLVFGGKIAGYLCIIETIGGILAMIAYHEKLERMYGKKEGGK
ncbi:MAG: hypothetical protein K2P19_10385 [Kineothrix sp.]|nr:hypothetical protein [Kineothrix sp.]